MESETNVPSEGEPGALITETEIETENAAPVLEMTEPAQQPQLFEENVATNPLLSTIFADDDMTSIAVNPVVNLRPMANSVSGNGDEITNPDQTKPKFNTIFNLSDDELNKLEKSLREKLTENGENFIQQHDNLRIVYEKFKIECEQRFIDLEAEYTECQTKLATELESSYYNKQKATENEDKVMNLSKQNKLLEIEKETMTSNQSKLNTINANLEAEKRELLSLLDKKIKENDRLNHEWKSMNVKLTESESVICELTAKVEEINHKESSINLREKQFQSDKERLLNEIDWLNNQLKEKSSQIIELKNSLYQKSYELESKIELLGSESKNLKTERDILQSTNEQLQKQLEEMSGKLSEAREREARIKNEFEEETQSREKLIELYQEENVGYKKRLEEAGQVVEELNQMILECKNEYSKVLDEKSLNENQYEAKLKENAEQIGRLEQELKNANELLSIAKRKGAAVLSESDIEQLSPAAAVASRLLKSGMTLTQIYSEYVNLTEILENERNEKERLKTYLSEVLGQIEEKAPILKRQKQDYDEALKAINNLTTQLENSMMDYETLKSKSEDSIKKYNLISSENVRLKQDVSDLSRQVTVLLYEIEKLRSKMLTSGKKAPSGDYLDTTLTNLFSSASNQTTLMMNESSLDTSLNEVSSSTETVSKNTLLFRSIDEMQKQNAKLARMLHELTDKKQSDEKCELEARTKEYNEKLSLAMRELEEFKQQREKQEQILEEISKQRDTYKQLLYQQQQGSIPLFTSTPGGFDRRTAANRPGSGVATKGPEMPTPSTSPSPMLTFNEMLGEQTKQHEQVKAHMQQRLDDMQTSHDKLQKQFDKFREEMVKTNQMLTDEIESYRVKNGQLSTERALAQSNLESSLDKFKTLNTVYERTRKELDSLKEKQSKLNEIIIKHEQSVNFTTAELNRSRERVYELETKLHSCQVERDMNKSNLDRLHKEYELLQREHSSRSDILSNLEILRAGMERNERETKLVYTQRIDQLEREMHILKKELETDREQHGVIVNSWQAQFKQLNEQYEREKTEAEKNRQQLADVRTQLDVSLAKCQEVEAKLHSNELIVQMSRNSKSSSSAISRLTHLEEETKEMKMKLSLADKEIVSLKIQLEDSKAHNKQYKNIADMMEKNLKESAESNEKAKAMMEAEMAELRDKLRQSHEDYEQTLSSRNQLNETLNVLRSEFEQKESAYEKEKSQYMLDLDLTRKQLENTELILEERTRLRDEYAANVYILEEQAKNTTDRINQLEEELNAARNDLNSTRNELIHRETELAGARRAKDETREAHTADEKLLNENLTSLKAENEQLLSQINMMQQELSKMGQDLVVLKREEPVSTVTTGTEGASSSVSNLLEINRYLRSEKEKLEEKCETLSLHNEFGQKKLKTIENELDSVRSQCQLYESEVNQLRQLLQQHGESATTADLNASSTNELILDTSRRLKDDLDSVNVENSKLNDELRRLEEEMNNLKSGLNASELKNESLKGENVCLKAEIDKWKNRLESLIRSSDYADEWNKFQTELKLANEKNVALEDALNQLRQNLNDVNVRLEQKGQECEQKAVELEQTRAKLVQDMENLRADKTKREEMFKMLIGELKEVVTSVQNELQLKNSDWSMVKGTMAERFRTIKDDLANIKKLILEKVRAEREEIKLKTKQVEEMTAQVQQMNQKLGECEKKVTEKETKIGQMNVFINNTKTKLQNMQKTNDELNLELREVKSRAGTQVQTEQQQTSTASNEQQLTQYKQEVDSLKSRLFQSQLENERLKKEQASGTPAAGSTSSGSSTSSATSSQSSQPSTSDSITGTQLPPTAYIAPSRIAKVNTGQPAQQQSQQQAAQQPQSSGLSLKRTAAVQPTPHESAGATRQQMVNPMSVTGESWSTMSSSQQKMQLQHEQGTENVQEHQAQQQQPQAMSGSFMTKRTREEDNTDESSTSGPSTSTTYGAANSMNKKQRNTFESSESVGTINDSNYMSTTVSGVEQLSQSDTFNDDRTEADVNDYIVIPDEIPTQEEAESQSEIVLNEESQEYEELSHQVSQHLNEENANNNNFGTDQDVIELDEPNSQQQQQQQDEGSQAELVEGDEQNNNNTNNDVEEIIDNNVAEENVENVDNQPNEDEDNHNQSDDLHLEMKPDDQEEQIDSESMQGKESNTEVKVSESQSADQEEKRDNQQTEAQTSHEEQSKRPTTEAANQPTRLLFGQNQAQKTIIEPKRELPKPIVWDGGNSTTAGGGGGGGVVKIKRTPVSQTLSTQQQSGSMLAQPLMQQQSSLFHQDVQFSSLMGANQQQPQQQAGMGGQPTFGMGFQSNQFRLQNNRFQLQNPNQQQANVSTSGLTGSISNQIGSSSVTLFGSSMQSTQPQQQQFMQNQQQLQMQQQQQRSFLRGPRAPLQQQTLQQATIQQQQINPQQQQLQQQQQINQQQQQQQQIGLRGLINPRGLNPTQTGTGALTGAQNIRGGLARGNTGPTGAPGTGGPNPGGQTGAGRGARNF